MPKGRGFVANVRALRQAYATARPVLVALETPGAEGRVDTLSTLEWVRRQLRSAGQSIDGPNGERVEYEVCREVGMHDVHDNTEAWMERVREHIASSEADDA